MTFDDFPRSTAQVGGHPIHAMLVPFPIACFVGALITDLVYWRTADMMWETFSVWLLTAGVVIGGLAVIAGLIDFVGSRRIRALGPAWLHALGNVLVLALALVNAFVHSRDGYTAVVPQGLILSALTVALLLFTGWMFRSSVPSPASQSHRRAPAVHRLDGPRHGLSPPRRRCRPMSAFRRHQTHLALVCTALSSLALAACDDRGGDPKRQIGANPVLPEPQQYLLPPMRIARTTKWGEHETPAVPKGLQVRALARGLEHPRSLYVLPNGDILVVEASGPKAPIHRPKDLIMGWVQSYAGASAEGGNRITLLRDIGDDGVAKTRTVFLDHLNSPFGVALVGQDLYVANTDAIMRYPYKDGETKITEPGTKLTDLPGGPIDHHWTKSLVASVDGSKLYVGVGSNSNITENGMPAELERAAIWEVDRASGAHRIFASGLRNPTGLGWEPQSHKLWAIANERDELGPDLVPDYLTSVRDGGFYGWPYSYYGQHLDPRVEPQRSDLVAKAIVPDYALSSHVAPLGVVFYTGSSLPAAYHGGAFVGEHGSWDRSPLNGYKVVYVPFSDGHPSGSAQDVVTGFLNANDQARGRPVGLAVDKTGGLLIADDLGDIVWRVTKAGP